MRSVDQIKIFRAASKDLQSYQPWLLMEGKICVVKAKLSCYKWRSAFHIREYMPHVHSTGGPKRDVLLKDSKILVFLIETEFTIEIDKMCKIPNVVS